MIVSLRDKILGMNLFVTLKRLSILSFVFCAFFLYGSVHTSAQIGQSTVNISPKYPGPFETVTIFVEDFSRDINSETISWSLNGGAAESGVGLKRFSFETGDLGTVSRVNVNIGGNSQEITVRPTKIDLIWQSDSYTPPFYRGKALHVSQDPITVVAEPHFINSQGGRINPNTLVYKWKRDGKVSNSASGYGKKTFTVTPAILIKPEIVEVEVSSSDGTFFSVGSVNIPVSSPEVLLFEDHPLYGTDFSKSLNNKEFEITNSEVKIAAFPNFFSNVQRLANGLTYNWRLNSNSLNQNSDEVIFRKPETGSGRSAISLEIRNTDRFMQTANTQTTATFSNETNSSAQNNF